MTEIRIPAGETDVTRVFHSTCPRMRWRALPNGRHRRMAAAIRPRRGQRCASPTRSRSSTLRDLGTMPALGGYLAQAYERSEGPDFARDRREASTR